MDTSAVAAGDGDDETRFWLWKSATLANDADCCGWRLNRLTSSSFAAAAAGGAMASLGRFLRLLFPLAARREIEPKPSQSENRRPWHGEQSERRPSSYLLT